MYDDLIKELRDPCPHENCILCQRAADVIEERGNAWEAGYDNGLSDAWGLARKIAMEPGEGGYDGEELREIFGTAIYADLFHKEQNPRKAFEKARTFDDKKAARIANIKPGDEITDGEVKAVALEVRDGWLYYIREGGVVSCYELNRNIWKPTGRCFTEFFSLMQRVNGGPDR